MVQQVLGLSGGKDSAALALYMNKHYPELGVTYYTCDTGKELKETYELIDKLSDVLSSGVKVFNPKETSDNPFDFYFKKKNGFLPSPIHRWCTHQLKILPFEHAVKDVPTISYVGIRGDENREGYISKNKNIQSIFPFRKNIWCAKVTKEVLKNEEFLIDFYKDQSVISELKKPLSISNPIDTRLSFLLNHSVKSYNKAVFCYLQGTKYPVGQLDSYELINNEDVVGLADVFQILKDSGVGIPKYYLPKEFEVDINGVARKGTYSRSRSGCYFCFYQQKIEWVWLLETHPELFDKAKSYEKDDFSWNQNESLDALSKPERVAQIKRNYLLKNRNKFLKEKQLDWVGNIKKAEGVGCASCFI